MKIKTNHIILLIGIVGFILYLLGFIYAVGFFLYLPQLPKSWTARLFFIAYLVGLGLIAFCIKQTKENAHPKSHSYLWAFLATFFLIIITFGVAVFWALVISAGPF